MDIKVSWRKDLGDMAFEGVGPSKKKIVMDSSPKHGGKGNGPPPMEVLLMGLGGCTAMDVLSVLRKKRQEVESLEVLIDGTRADEFPKEYKKVNLRYVVKGKNIKEEAVRRAVELSQDKYCGASETFRKQCEITSSFKIIDV
jgi:putative redox protein